MYSVYSVYSGLYSMYTRVEVTLGTVVPTRWAEGGALYLPRSEALLAWTSKYAVLHMSPNLRAD